MINPSIFHNRCKKQQKSTVVYLSRTVAHFYWSLALILGLSSCTPPGGNQKIPQVKLTVRNTLQIQRKNVPIVISLNELQRVAPDFSFDAYLVVSGQPPTEIDSQVDDTNYDGKKDELVFLVDLEPQETKEVSIRYSPDNPMSVTIGFTKRTRAGIFPELNGFAALESEFAAYLLKHNGSIQAYGKRRRLLFNIESHFQSYLNDPFSISAELLKTFENNGAPLSQNTALEIQKPDTSWLIADKTNKQTYFVRKESGRLNIYKAEGLSLDRLVYQTTAPSDANGEFMKPLIPVEGAIGCGGFALWDKTNRKLIEPLDTTDYVRVLADGPVRSVVQRLIPDWQLKNGTIQFTSTFSVYAGNRWIEHRINVQGLTSEYLIATGIPNLGAGAVKNKVDGWLSTWGEQNTGIGMGMIFPADAVESFQDLTPQDSEKSVLAALMRPSEGGEVAYRFLSVWSADLEGIQTKAEFEAYIQNALTQMHTPPVIQFLPQTEKEN